MNLKDIAVKFDVSEVQQIFAIEMDCDPQKALSFIKECLLKKARKALESR